MNIIDEIKLFFAAKDAADKLKTVPKLNVFDPAHIAMLLAIGATLYKGTLGIAPSQWSLALGVGLAVGFLLYSLILRLHHQPAAPIAGIPAVDINAVIAALEAKYPALKQYEVRAKAILAKLKVIPTAGNADNIPQPLPGSPKPQ